MTKRLKVGLVGAGVGQGHADAYKALPEQFELAAFCDINEEKAAAFATKNDIGTVVYSLEDLLALDLDLIDLCTPSGLHYSQTLEVLKAGRNVIVEKPLAASLAEVDRIKAAEAGSAGTVFPIFQYRFGHGVSRLLHLREKGLVGPASVATAETHWRRTEAYYAAGPWRGKWATELGGCLATHAIHIHDLLRLVLGPIDTVYARASNDINGNETEDRAILALTFKEGGFATSAITLGSHQQTSRLRFCFEGVTVESGLDPYNPGHEPWSFHHEEGDGQKDIEEALVGFSPLPERFVGQLFRIHLTLTEGAPTPVTVDDARAAIELLTAAYASIQSGQPVQLPIGPEHPFFDGWVETMETEFGHGQP